VDVVGAIGGAVGAGAWAIAGARLVSHLRPARQLPVFAAGAVVCALAGGLAGSALTPDHPHEIVRAVAVESHDTTPPAPPEPEPTTTTEPSTTTTVTTAPPSTTTTVRHTTTTVRRFRSTPTTVAQQITARCADGWGIYGRNRYTHACDTHGGVAYWIVPPTN
jgi:hypothetical protein